MQTPPVIKVGCINRGWKTFKLKELGEEQASTITTLVWVMAIFCSLVSCLPIAYTCVWIKNFFRTMNLFHGVLTLPFFARFKTEPIDVLDRWLLVVSAAWYEYIAPRKLPKNRLVTQVLGTKPVANHLLAISASSPSFRIKLQLSCGFKILKSQWFPQKIDVLNSHTFILIKCWSIVDDMLIRSWSHVNYMLIKCQIFMSACWLNVNENIFFLSFFLHSPFFRVLGTGGSTCFSVLKW